METQIENIKSQGRDKVIEIAYSIINDKMDVFFRFDIADPNDAFTYDKNSYTDDNKDDLSREYFVTGLVLNCGSGLSVAPNMRKITYEGDAKNSETEYKVNFQFKF